MISKKEASKSGLNIVDTATAMTDSKMELIEQVKSLLPNIVNSDNQVDTKALNDLFDITNTTSNNQGYELTFAGKGLARAKTHKETTKELKVEAEQSKDFDNTENVIIRGDNIDTLKILYKNYHNKIKMIYIDPPYNTKSENFIYNDNFKQSEAKLIKDFGLGDDTSNFLDNVYGTRSHSGWLSFMYPRLQLAKELLSDDGVIFISIDDNEQANLKIMCDEIFGEGMAESYIWNLTDFTESSFTKTASNTVRTDHEYIIACYKKKKSLNRYREFRFKDREDFGNIDSDSRGAWMSGNMSRNGITSTTGSKYYEITSPTGNKYKRNWTVTKEEFDDLLKDNRIYFSREGAGVPRLKIFKNEPSYSIQNSILTGLKTSITGKNQLKKLFKGVVLFSFPKPTDLIKRFGELSCDKNDTILDFFAGSGTTAHAVMQLNAEDGGNRKFILCQLDEKIDPVKQKPAFDFCTENKFEPVISSITIERVNRAGDKIKAEIESKADMLSENKKLDIGYKIFSLIDKPNVNYDEKQKSFKIENKRTNNIDTLVNMLVATCKTLDVKIEEIKKNAIYKADNEIYVISKTTSKDLEPFKDLKINIDSMADINLEEYLNLDISNKDNITIIY